MIINIRGTSGSGKSTLVRNIRQAYSPAGALKERYRVGRKQPIATLVGDGPALFIPGHYNTACGGCDTITKMDDVFRLVRYADDRGWHVLFEGLLVSADSRRTMALHHEGRQVIVLALDLPLQECLDSVNSRRRQRRPDAPDVNPKNTESKWKGVRSSMKKMQENGVACEWHDRQSAEARALQLLGVAHNG